MKLRMSFFLLAVCAFCFCCKENQSNNRIDQYQFDRIKKVNSLGKMSLKLKDNKILMSSDSSKITAPLKYKDDDSKLNFNNIYRLVPENGDARLFRFGWISYKDNRNVLNDVVWLENPPAGFGSFTDYHVETVKIPFKQHGDLKICTIGDSQTWWKRSGKLRLELNKLHPDFYFTGSNTDRYGYPHEGEGGNTTKKVLKRVGKIPRADYYTLLLGTNDYKKGENQAFENIQLIVDKLLEKYQDATILYLTPLPTTNEARDEFNKDLARRLKKTFTKNTAVEVVDVRAKFLQNTDWKDDYLRADGLHPSSKGNMLMAQTIAHYFKSGDSRN